MPRKFFFGDIFKDGRYTPLNADMFGPAASGNWDKWLAPGYARVLAAALAGDPRPALTVEAPGVYSFDLFTEEFCDILVAEVEHAQRTSHEQFERPNGMNRYGIVLNQLGLEPLITGLQQERLLPLQAALYPEEGSAADDHHCFIVRYKAGEDVGLDMHEDDSDVTLNVCLGKEFSAATLSFCGLAADEDHRKLKHTYSHKKGRAVIHRGRHRHGADNIDSGERVNFILWSTSRRYRASEAYHRERMRSVTAPDPDPICLSYTHDRDYIAHLQKPTNEEALARGVMLDIVEKRHAMYQRLVHDLARPLEDINHVPSVCLFMEGLPPRQQHALFGALSAIAADVSARARLSASKPQLHFFVAAQPVGAVPQVRQILGIDGSPGLAILDIQGERRYRLPQDVALNPDSMGDFVEGFLKGRLTSDALSDA